MEFSEVVRQRRTIRRYRQQDIPDAVLKTLLESLRFSPTGGNMQHLRYIVVRNESTAKALFELAAFGALVRPRRSPQWGKDAPRCFVAVTAPENSPAEYAHAGAAIQTLLLGATSLGLGGCWIGAFDRQKAETLLKVPAGMSILYLVALGYPDEAPVFEDAPSPEAYKYYLDEADRLHVPKLKLDDLVRWV